MDISIKNQPIAIESYINPVGGKPKGEAPGEPLADSSGVKTDSVHISESARRIQEAQKAVSELPDIREEKVAALRKVIAEGRYEIKADEIAEKMLGEALSNDLFG